LNQVEEIVGVITEAGDARFVSLDGGQQFFGQISVDGNAASGSLRAVSLLGGQFPNGASSGTININATVNERDSISGSFVGVGDEGAFSLTYDSLYDLDSSLDLVAQHWTSTETIFKSLVSGFGSAPFGGTVDDTGNFAAADLDGCDYAGLISVLDTQYNIYEISMTVSSCGSWDGSYNGVGVFDNVSGPNITLTLAVATDQISIAGDLTETAPESITGIWGGTILSDFTGPHETVGLISEENDAQFFSTTGAQIVGNAEVLGNIFRMDAVAYAPFGTTHVDGSVRGSVDVRGLVTTGFQSTGSFVGVGDSGTYDIFYDALYERSSSLARVEGSWVTPSPTGGITDLVVTVEPTGQFTGAGDGCTYNGTISLIDTNFNAYRMSVEVLNCGGITGTYSGLGALSDDQSLNDTLSVSVNNDVTSLWAIFSRAP
jgi:hypothetical protein